MDGHVIKKLMTVHQELAVCNAAHVFPALKAKARFMLAPSEVARKHNLVQDPQVYHVEASVQSLAEVSSYP